MEFYAELPKGQHVLGLGVWAVFQAVVETEGLFEGWPRDASQHFVPVFVFRDRFRLVVRIDFRKHRLVFTQVSFQLWFSRHVRIFCSMAMHWKTLGDEGIIIRNMRTRGRRFPHIANRLNLSDPAPRSNEEKRQKQTSVDFLEESARGPLPIRACASQVERHNSALPETPPKIVQLEPQTADPGSQSSSLRRNSFYPEWLKVSSSPVGS